MPIPRLRRLPALLAAFVALLALVAGCASHEQPSLPANVQPPATGAASTFPVRLTVPGGGSLTLAKQPQRIVSLSPTSTETLYAIGAGKQVVAVDSQSDYPAQAPRTKLSALTPNTEAIANYKPDLVISSADTGKLVANLGKVHVPVLVLPAANTLQDAYDADGGARQGDRAPDRGRHAGRAAMQNKITTVVAKAPEARQAARATTTSWTRRSTR